LQLNYQKSEFDRRDPQRGASSLAYYIGSYKTLSDGSPLFELWPHPTLGQYLTCLYQQRGTSLDFSGPTDTLPAVIPEELLFQRALSLGAQWAQMNSGLHKELQGVDWSFTAASS
jgi:hypothetical protein